MTKGISIHIGLNGVDPAQYNGWPGTLSGCVNDANSMRDIAQQVGYSPVSVLLNEQANSANVLQAIGQAAQTLESGDILLLTYSGHGGQVPDENNDEEDGQDETWVLYDRMLIDDELYLMWSQFAAGVRIFILSDSCHSGTLAKSIRNLRGYGRKDADIFAAYKAIPTSVAHANYYAHLSEYRAIQWTATKGKKAPIDATVVLISGCADSQFSGDGPRNGVFTGALLDVWQNGAFRGNYAAFRSAIVAQIDDDTQVPEYMVVGAANPAFEAERPFTITSGATISSVPQITPSPLWSQGDPPLFSVSPSPNSFYAVEVATDSSLFDSASFGDNRTEDNFYASWSELGLLSDSEYQLPQSVWERLSSSGSELYYRVVTSSSGSKWQNLIYSTDDDQAANAPSITISRAYHRVYQLAY